MSNSFEDIVDSASQRDVLSVEERLDRILFRPRPTGPEERLWVEVEAILATAVPESVRGLLRKRADYAGWVADIGARSAPESVVSRVARLVQLAFDAQELSRASATVRVGSPSPDDWQETSRRVFDGLRDLQREAWKQLRSRRALSPEQLKARLERLRSRERPEGDRLLLHYPTGSEPPWAYLEARLGFSRTEWEERFFSGDPDLHDWVAERLQPLAALSRLQDHVQNVTGVAPWEATSFLVCDVVPLLPRVRVDVPGERGPVRLLIGAPVISGEEVRLEYEARLAALGVASGSARKPSRRSNADVADEFERAYRRPDPERGGKTPTYEETFEAFNREHPGLYRDYKSFAETVRQKRRGS